MIAHATSSCFLPPSCRRPGRVWLASVLMTLAPLRQLKIHQRLKAPFTVQMVHHINSSPVFIHNRRNRSRRPRSFLRLTKNRLQPSAQ